MSSITRRNIVILLFDFAIALFAFGLACYFGNLSRWYWLVLSALIWAILGEISGKLQFEAYKRKRYAVMGILIVGILSGLFLYFLYRQFLPGYEYDYSILIATGGIIFMEWGLYYSFRRLVYQKIPFFYEEPLLYDVTEVGLRNKAGSAENIENKDIGRLLKVLKEKKTIDEVTQWMKDHLDLFDRNTILIDSTNPECVLTHKIKSPQLIIYSYSLNEIRHLNTFLSYANYCLDMGGCIVCHCVTSGVRKKKIFRQNPAGINYILYSLDYFWHRVSPKLPVFQSIYYGITKGKRRVLTRVEVLGRLYRAGFDVIHEEINHGEFLVAASKIKEPIRDDKPSSGLLIRLKRKGKDGETIGVYKFRTMHAYSEYLQPYIYKEEGLCAGGKISNDYRINLVGKLLRSTWLDELPMLINWIKGDLKLVGVRPLSNHYFSLYTKDLQELRIKTKPGLIPPFYADMPATLEEIQESEKRYLNAYMENTFLTDWRYFWRALWNIVAKRKRSR